MAAQTGRTNNKYIGFWLDNAGGTLTDLTSYLKSVNAVGVTYDQQDVTGMNDGTKNYTVGWGDAPITATFQFDTTVFAHLIALPTTQPLSLDVRFGIRQAQVTGEPQFGISMSATSGYTITSLICNQTDDITATFCVFGSTAPAFGTTNET
jgi:hypothetical protein